MDSEDDPEQQMLDNQFTYFIQQHLPKEAKDWTPEKHEEYLEQLYEKFCEKKREEWREQQRINECVEIIKTRLPKETKFPELFSFDTWRNGVCESFIKAIESIKSQLKQLASSEQIVVSCPSEFEELAPYVFRVKIFTESFCAKLGEFLIEANAWCEENDLRLSRPNTMNRYGAILAHLGLERLCSTMMQELVQPVCDGLFPHISNAPEAYKNHDMSLHRIFDMHHTFMVAYKTDIPAEKSNDNSTSLDKPTSPVIRELNTSNLDLHVDDSHLTMSVCLGPEFTGGELIAKGYRCPQHIQDIPQCGHNENNGDALEQVNCGASSTEEALTDRDLEKCNNLVLEQHVGWGFFHMGNLRHAALPITSGSRVNMIMWCKSSMFEEKILNSEEKYICGICLGKEKNTCHHNH